MATHVVRSYVVGGRTLWTANVCWSHRGLTAGDPLQPPYDLTGEELRYARELGEAERRAEEVAKQRSDEEFLNVVLSWELWGFVLFQIALAAFFRRFFQALWFFLLWFCIVLMAGGLPITILLNFDPTLESVPPPARMAGVLVYLIWVIFGGFLTYRATMKRYYRPR